MNVADIRNLATGSIGSGECQMANCVDCSSDLIII
jgi:hypothetical protein